MAGQRGGALAAFRLLALGAVASGLCALTATDAGAEEKAPEGNPSCIEYMAKARYVGIGFEHRVYVRNACEKPAECVVTTDVNPERMRARVDANTIMTFITYRGSPAYTFVASVQCELVR